MLIDAADRHVLRSELAQRSIHFSETPLFKINLNGASAHQLLKAIDTPLTVVQVHTPTVEDAYLAILEQA